MTLNQKRLYKRALKYYLEALKIKQDILGKPHQ
jgi:hypothetical protein